MVKAMSRTQLISWLRSFYLLRNFLTPVLLRPLLRDWPISEETIAPPLHPPLFKEEVVVFTGKRCAGDPLRRKLKWAQPTLSFQPFSGPILSQMEANPDVQMITKHPGKALPIWSRLLYLFDDLGCRCKHLLLANYKEYEDLSAWQIPATEAIYVLRFCWGLSTTLCFNPSTPTFCSLDIQLFRQIPLRKHQSNHPFVSGSQVPCNHSCFPPEYTSFTATSEELFKR